MRILKYYRFIITIIFQHVHVHILPRKQGDFNDNDDIYRVLQKHDKPGSPMEVPPRNDKEMTEESEFLRGFFL